MASQPECGESGDGESTARATLASASPPEPSHARGQGGGSALRATASAGSRPPVDWVAEQFSELETRLVAYVRRACGCNLETAQDVVQEAFVRLCQQAWPDIEGHATAWLFRTCRNRAIDIQRREGRMSAIHSDNDLSTVRDPTDKRPDDSASQDEQLDRMRDKISDLPERQQELLRLRLQEGLSYRQIAAVTGLTVTNVGYLLHRAISSLRLAMQID